MCCLWWTIRRGYAKNATRDAFVDGKQHSGIQWNLDNSRQGRQRIVEISRTTVFCFNHVYQTVLLFGSIWWIIFSPTDGGEHKRVSLGWCLSFVWVYCNNSYIRRSEFSQKKLKNYELMKPGAEFRVPRCPAEADTQTYLGALKWKKHEESW